MTRSTPTVVHTAQRFTLHAFQCVPAAVLTEQIDYLADQLTDPAIRLTIAERERLNRLGDDMEEALSHVRHQTAVKSFTLQNERN